MRRPRSVPRDGVMGPGKFVHPTMPISCLGPHSECYACGAPLNAHDGEGNCPRQQDGDAA